MKRTLKEVAALTGFSPATLSRVLTKNKNVNEETRRKVEDALSRHGFEMNKNKRKKYTGKSVLIITGETHTHFHRQMYERLSAELRKNGLVVLLADSGFDSRLDETYIEYAQDRKFCGIIMVTPVETERLKELIAGSSCPVILINRHLRSLDTDAVFMDNYRAGYMTAKHLLAKGHRKIACVSGGKAPTSSVDRVAGFVDALTEAGLGVKDYLVWDGDFKKTGGTRFGQLYAASLREYSAVFCVNEPTATGFAEAVFDAGIVIPRDVSLICVAPIPVTIPGGPQVTCVIHDAEQFGATAAELLLQRLRGSTEPPRKIIFPPRLCIRDSVQDLTAE